MFKLSLRLRSLPLSRRAAVVGALALAAGFAAFQLTADAAAAQARFGETVGVVVLQRDVDAGAILGPDDVAIESLPIALVPDGALRVLPVGSALRGNRHGRSVLADDDLAGAEGSAARIPPGWRGVALESTLLPVSPGDLVDVVATFDALIADGKPSIVVAEAAVVVDVSEESVTIAVPAALTPAVSYAVVNATVTLTLIG